MLCSPLIISQLKGSLKIFNFSRRYWVLGSVTRPRTLLLSWCVGVVTFEAMEFFLQGKRSKIARMNKEKSYREFVRWQKSKAAIMEWMTTYGNEIWTWNFALQTSSPGLCMHFIKLKPYHWSVIIFMRRKNTNAWHSLKLLSKMASRRTYIQLKNSIQKGIFSVPYFNSYSVQEVTHWSNTLPICIITYIEYTLHISVSISDDAQCVMISAPSASFNITWKIFQRTYSTE